jgi:radical SAM superfamily enzyme YgiQ (UPF0313 family)
LALHQRGLGRAKILDLRSVSAQLGLYRARHAEYFSRYAAGLDPVVVGITAVSATIGNALFLAQLAKTLFPSAFVVLGGHHASYEWRTLLNANRFLDAVVIGEGEIPFPALVERVAHDRNGAHDFHGIEGVAWRGPDGAAISTGWCRGHEDLDQLSFPDDRAGLLNAADYEIKYGRVITARGCPFKCSFCSTAEFTGRRVRKRRAEGLLDELRYYRDTYGVKRFSFDDDIFTVDRKRALEICQAIISSGLFRTIEWGCNTRMDCIDELLIDVMAQAGCRFILFGIESGSPEVQDRFGKGRRSLHRFREKLTHMLRKGIEPQLNFILGLPGEDSNSILLIRNLLKGLPGTVPCAFNFLNVFPATPLEKQASDLGIEFLSEAPEGRFSIVAPTVHTPTMTAEEQIKAYLSLSWFREVDQLGTGDAGNAPVGPLSTC